MTATLLASGQIQGFQFCVNVLLLLRGPLLLAVVALLRVVPPRGWLLGFLVSGAMTFLLVSYRVSFIRRCCGSIPSSALIHGSPTLDSTLIGTPSGLAVWIWTCLLLVGAWCFAAVPRPEWIVRKH
jgi:hypothetical protein